MELTRPEATRLLMIAVQTGNLGSIRIALDCHADVNKRDKNGRTPLIRACRAPDPDPRVIRCLLREGADVGVTDRKGLSALDYARRELLERQLPADDPEAVAQDRDRAARAFDMPEEELMEDFEREMLRERAKDMPENDYAEFRALYVASRREAAARDYFDTAKIERVIELLEQAGRRK